LKPGRAAEMGLIGYFARHRTLANLLLVIMVVAGLAAADRMRAQYFPDVILSEVDVTVDWPGAGAEDVDRSIVQLLEPGLLALEGVNGVYSVAGEGRASIEVEFEPGRDLAEAEETVQTAVDAVSGLPEGIETPEVEAAEWRDRVTDVLISGPVGVDQLARFADDLVGRLFRAGITRATITGLADPETVVEISAVELMRHDLTLAEVARAISAAVADRPAGDLDETTRLRTASDGEDPAGLAAIRLKAEPDGTTLTLGDIATLTRTEANAVRAAFVGADPAMVIRIDRGPEGDAIALQASVAEVAAGMQPGLPEGVTVELVRTRAEQISDRLELLIDNGIMGLALVLVLLFLFLNARIAFWVAAGIPVAMIAALAGMYGLGLTLNMISLFALIIMLGIVVDDAIVVGEHADFRARVLGEPPEVAAENAARWMAAPVLASSITTIVAFLGLLAVEGRFGDLITAIPITVSVVLVASLIECFLILPNHLRHALVAGGEGRWYDWPSRQVNLGMVWLQAWVIRPFTRMVILGRYPVLAAAVLALAWHAALFLKGEVQFRFFNPPEQASVTGSFEMLPGAARADTLEMLTELQRATEAVLARFEAEHGQNPARFVLAEIGGTAGRSASGTKGPDLLGSIAMELIGPDERSYPTSAVIAALEAEIVAHPLLEDMSFRNARFGPGGASLSVDLSAGDEGSLRGAAEALKAALSAYPEVSGLEDSLSFDKDELVLTLTPQGQALGFDTEVLGQSLRDSLHGIEAATYPEGPREASIRVALPEAELTADFVETIQIRAAPGLYVPLAEVVTVERRAGTSSIRRENGLRIASVTGELSEADPARATEVQRALSEDILPRLAQDHGVGWQLSGQAADEREFLGGALVALGLCLLGIYLTLAWIFAHWTRPLVVMSVIPFGLVGAIFGHWVWEMPLSMFSIVGLIGMSGIIINDAIVLVSTIDEYAVTRNLRTAIVDGVADRFRAVLLTTLTTVLGLAPLLYEGSSQAEFLKPTVLTLVFGLGFGMVLVLIVVPAVLAIQADMAGALRSLRRGVRRGPVGLRRVLLGSVAVLVALALALPVWTGLNGQVPAWVRGVLPDGVAPGGGMAAMAGFVVLGGLVWLAAVVAGLTLVRKPGK
jgi:multidrug efflux pump subunit AcrB